MELRADIAVGHRREWHIVHSLLGETVKGLDSIKAKLANAVAETLKILGDGRG